MKTAKIFAPRKVKGGAIVGKDGEVWYAIKCTNFTPAEHRAFKTYIGEACKEFFEPESDSQPE